MTKSYEEYLDEVARRKGWKDWPEMFQDQFIGSTVYDGSIITYAKEAALLYGEAKFNEGAEEQKALCDKEICELLGINSEAPKPTFKP